MATGKIKKVVADRGFGFITADDGKDYFFHRNGMGANLDFERLVGGESVVFNVEHSPKGAVASDIGPAPFAPPPGPGDPPDRPR